MQIKRLHPGEKAVEDRGDEEEDEDDDMNATTTPHLTLNQLNEFGRSVHPLFNLVPSIKIVLVTFSLCALVCGMVGY